VELGRVGGPHVAGQLRHEQQPARFHGRPPTRSPQPSTVVHHGRRRCRCCRRRCCSRSERHRREPVCMPVLRQDVSPGKLPEKTRTGGFRFRYYLAFCLILRLPTSERITITPKYYRVCASGFLIKTKYSFEKLSIYQCCIFLKYILYDINSVTWCKKGQCQKCPLLGTYYK